MAVIIIGAVLGLVFFGIGYGAGLAVNQRGVLNKVRLIAIPYVTCNTKCELNAISGLRFVAGRHDFKGAGQFWWNSSGHATPLSPQLSDDFLDEAVAFNPLLEGSVIRRARDLLPRGGLSRATRPGRGARTKLRAPPPLPGRRRLGGLDLRYPVG